MKRAVVTGGAGFIGSYLVDRLRSQGVYVDIVDIKNTEHPIDVRDFEAVQQRLKGADTVFHLAAISSVPYSIEYPRETHDVNVNGMLNVLTAARDCDVSKVILISSAAVYGDQQKPVMAETMRPAPASPYGLQKYIGERYAQVFSTLYNLNTVSIRPFNVYGLRQSSELGALIPVFFERLKNNQPLLVTGDGEQTRDFLHVRDAISAIIAAAFQDTKPGSVINIGSGIKTSVNTVAKLIGGVVEYIPARSEIKDSCADISKAQNVLKWEPTITLEEGIKELIEHGN